MWMLFSLISCKSRKRPQVMTIRILSLIAVAASILSGCTTQDLTRDLLCDRDSGGKAASRAVRCMAVAGIEVAQRKPEKSEEHTSADKDEDKNADPRYKEWIP
jgi:hypothetical protein